MVSTVFEQKVGAHTFAVEADGTIVERYKGALELVETTTITEQMYAILYEGRAPAEALRALMTRDPKPEEWS